MIYDYNINDEEILDTGFLAEKNITPSSLGEDENIFMHYSLPSQTFLFK